MAEKKEKKYIIENSALMAEWDWEKNNELGLNPNVLTEGSGKQASWICSLGHRWFATPLSRTCANGTGCPYCSGHRLLVGFNDLQTIAPEVMLDWDFNANRALDLDPYNIKACSSKKAWWVCHLCGYKWQTTIEARAIRHRGCIKCNHKQGIANQSKKHIETNGSLLSVFPEIASEWHPTLNGSITSGDVSPNSNKYAWWICKNGHTWKSKINHRANGSGCPYCANQKVFAGFNDLATLYPLLLKEWHPTKNLPLIPQECLAGGQKKCGGFAKRSTNTKCHWRIKLEGSNVLIVKTQKF